MSPELYLTKTQRLEVEKMIGVAILEFDKEQQVISKEFREDQNAKHVQNSGKLDKLNEKFDGLNGLLTKLLAVIATGIIGDVVVHFIK